MKKQRSVAPHNSSQVIAAQHTVTHYQGDIPHPDILKGFDEISPGTAKKLIDLAIEQSSLRIAMESKALDANIVAQENQFTLQKAQIQSVTRIDMAGQAIGFAVCIACISGAVYLGTIPGKEWIAGILAAIPTASLIRAFFVSKK